MAEKNEYGFTILMPDLPGDLVDTDGTHVDYEGTVYRADEVDRFIERLMRPSDVSQPNSGIAS